VIQPSRLGLNLHHIAKNRTFNPYAALKKPRAAGSSAQRLHLRIAQIALRDLIAANRRGPKASKEALKELKEGIDHPHHKGLDNRAEASYRHTRRPNRWIARFKPSRQRHNGFYWLKISLPSFFDANAPL